jgi:magnesium-transporting ATPase (P-type)
VQPSKEVDLAETLLAGFLCNNAFITKENGNYKISGDPTEGALVVAATKAGLSKGPPMLDQIPFGSEHRYMATLHEDNGGNIIYVKGSPEKVLNMCREQLIRGKIEPLDSQLIADTVEKMAGDALRLLGLAMKRVPADKQTLDAEDLEGMVFIGLHGMIDPPREEAIEAIRKCKRAGIRVVMITGDHAGTARAIAEQLGLGGSGEVLTGEHLSAMNDDELYEVVDRISVYARVAPIDKYRVTTQLQKRDHIVAMTGDGVNDAPALKAADIGIAMGLKGTDVSKEAADMVLVDDNFASIVAAVEQGRYVFDNIRKVILYTLPTNGGQSLIVLGAIILIPFVALFEEQLPLEPIQILWINLYDAIALALPLLWEPREEGLLYLPPRDPREPIANQLFFRKVILVSIVMAAAAFVVYYHFGHVAISGPDIDELRLGQAQTAAFLTVMIVHIFYLLTARSLTKSVFTTNPFGNRMVVIGISVSIALHLLLVYVLPSAGFNPFRLESFPAYWWGLIIAFGIVGLLLVELEELVVDRLGKILKRKA